MTDTQNKPSTRDRLIRAALELFQMRGYHATGVSEILTRAHCPKGSLYHHFPGGKSELAVAAIEWLESQMIAHFDAARDKAVPAHKQVTLLFRQTSDWVSGAGFGVGALLSVMAQEVAPDDAVLTQRLGAAYAKAITHFDQALQAGGASGDMAGPIIAMLDGAVAQARAQTSTAPFDMSLTAALRLLE